MKKIFVKVCLLYYLYLPGCISRADKIDFYIPNEFSGNVIVLYNCSNGIDPLIKNGRTQINIPLNGIARIKAPIKYGEIDYKYFLQIKGGIELKVHQSFEKDIPEEKYIGPGTVVTVYDSLEKSNSRNEQSAFIFYVYKKGGIIPSNYNDRWIEDTLRSQLKIIRRVP